MSFGETLKHYRTQIRLSQAKLAAATPCDHSLISRCESGQRQPTRQMCVAIARALELSPDDTARLMESAGYVVDDLPALVRGELGLVRLARLLADPDVSEAAQRQARNLVDAAVLLCEQDAALWADVREEAA